MTHPTPPLDRAPAKDPNETWHSGSGGYGTSPPPATAGIIESSFDQQSPGFVTEAGLQAIKAVMVANGGAGIALLAFFGDFDRTAASAHTLSSLSEALASFAIGTAAAVLAFGIRYLSQASYGRQFVGDHARATRHGDHFRNAAAVAVLCSFVAFATGGIQAASGLASPPIQPPAATGPTAVVLPAAPAHAAGKISHELPMPRPPYIENQEVKLKE